MKQNEGIHDNQAVLQRCRDGSLSRKEMQLSRIHMKIEKQAPVETTKQALHLNEVETGAR